uniref:Si:dkey-238o13.4 n=1 Tax=Cyprinus carpio TaxID=7962 RepID=A0A8C2B8C9_CYPCA
MKQNKWSSISILRPFHTCMVLCQSYPKISSCLQSTDGLFPLRHVHRNTDVVRTLEIALPTTTTQTRFKVAVISRESSNLEKLKGFVSPSTKSNLTTLVGNVGSEEGAEEVKQALLKSVGKITDVVSSLGFSWWQGGPPHTQTLKELHWVIETLLFSTFVSWKAFFPLVRDDTNCTYTFITGGGGEKVLMPGTGFLTVGAASALAFCQVLREEYPEVPCKVNQVKINTGVAAPDRMAPGYLNHLDLGEAVATLVERRNTSHTVFPVSCLADLKTVMLEGNL